MSSQVVTIILALVAGGMGAGFTVPFFKYLSAARKQTIAGKNEAKAQSLAGSQVYIATLEKRIDKQDERIDKIVHDYESRLAAKDTVIDTLQGEVTALTIEVAAQKNTIIDLQKQITTNKV